ncbi:MAG: GIY-YIG nuclease family protein [Candidatus Taylorbacteria bacterium]|nr:GIY-YIG nuclease family protein [Candidatus Taylorbacteria bacterium]
MPYYVYILQCADNTLYTGCTNDLKRRVEEHNFGKRGAKYTKARRPVVLKYKEEFKTLKKARKKEAEIKRLSRKEKVALLALYCTQIKKSPVDKVL